MAQATSSRLFALAFPSPSCSLQCGLLPALRFAHFLPAHGALITGVMISRPSRLGQRRLLSLDQAKPSVSFTAFLHCPSVMLIRTRMDSSVPSNLTNCWQRLQPFPVAMDSLLWMLVMLSAVQ